jgi:hypothetical protein
MAPKLSARIVACALFACACDDATPLGVAYPRLELTTRALDFGPVPEGESLERAVELTNAGQVPLAVTLSLEGSSSRDFVLGTTSLTIEATSKKGASIIFTPDGAGSDSGKILLVSDDPENRSAEIEIAGGPIAPSILASPDPLDFGPAGELLEIARPISVQNRGDASLAIAEILIDPEANTDFVLRSVVIPEKLSPDGELELVIDYRRSERGTPGRLLIRSDDPQTPELAVRLIPDPLRACEDSIDNDGDELVDFPDDPGCTSNTDDGEENPPECEDGTTSPCGTASGECELGTRSCANRLWGPCMNEIGPSAELCDGLDNDCDDRTDDGISEPCATHGCAGVRACVEGSLVPGGEWSSCIAVSPNPESCDGADNDCNGEIDEGIVETCTVNSCSGQRVCIPGGSGEFTNCQVATSAEICDGADNDCNGVEDDGIADIVCGQGRCQQTAVACVAGLEGTCTPGQPISETCNNADDDCDGMPDNNIPNLTCGQGVCASSVAACVNGNPATCTPGQSGVETCNGLDDDCDGTPDDGVCMTCGLAGNTPDALEPNNAPNASNPSVANQGLGTFTHDYDLTLTPGDTDWLEFRFPAPGTGSFAQVTASITCASWFAAGCAASAPTVGLEAWYFDDCFPQQDDVDNGQAGLASVSSSGPIASFGFCGIQRFRVHVTASTNVCANEALNAQLRVQLTWSP